MKAEDIAASLSPLERELIEGTSQGWGSWMWAVSGDLIRKGLMADEGVVRILTPLGKEVRFHLMKERGE